MAIYISHHKKVSNLRVAIILEMVYLSNSSFKNFKYRIKQKKKKLFHSDVTNFRERIETDGNFHHLLGHHGVQESSNIPSTSREHERCGNHLECRSIAVSDTEI